MMSEALQAQIKIDQGTADPGLQSAGFGLMSDAVNWLLGDAPFVYAPVGGNVDANHNGLLDAGATNAGFEYNTATQSFTTPPLKTTMAAGQKYVDVVSSTPHSGDLLAKGNDLLNALTAFNAGELVTLAGGAQVGWESGGTRRRHASEHRDGLPHGAERPACDRRPDSCLILAPVLSLTC